MISCIHQTTVPCVSEAGGIVEASSADDLKVLSVGQPGAASYFQ